MSQKSFGLVKMRVMEACSVLGKANKPAPFHRPQPPVARAARTLIAFNPSPDHKTHTHTHTCTH